MSLLLHLVSPVLLTLPTLEAPAPSRPASAAPSFVAEMGYFLEGTGEWWAQNPDWHPGQNRPQFYVYGFAWDLNRHVAQLRIEGLFEDGRLRSFWFYVYSWHPIDRRVVLHGYSPDGTIIDGYSEPLVNGRADTYLHGINRVASEFDLLDSIHIMGPDLFESVSYQRTPQGYQLQQTLLWSRRVPPEVAHRSTLPIGPGTGITK